MIPIMPWDILGLLGSAVGNVITVNRLRFGAASF